jgi:hypothetical protein
MKEYEVHAISVTTSPSSAEQTLWHWAACSDKGATIAADVRSAHYGVVQSIQRELLHLEACNSGFVSALARPLTTMTNVYLLFLSLSLLFTDFNDKAAAGEYEHVLHDSSSFASIISVLLAAVLAALLLETGHTLLDVQGLPQELANKWVAELGQDCRKLTWESSSLLAEPVALENTQDEKKGVEGAGETMRDVSGRVPATERNEEADSRAPEEVVQGVGGQGGKNQNLNGVGGNGPAAHEVRNVLAPPQMQGDTETMNDIDPRETAALHRAVMLLMHKMDCILDLQAMRTSAVPMTSKHSNHTINHSSDALPALGYSSYRPLSMSRGREEEVTPANLQCIPSSIKKQCLSPQHKVTGHIYQELPAAVDTDGRNEETSVSKRNGAELMPAIRAPFVSSSKAGGQVSGVKMRSSGCKPLAYEASRIRMSVDDLSAHLKSSC